MKFTFALAVANAYALVDEQESQFLEFVQKYDRSYNTREEFDYRLGIFKQRLAEHEAHNSKEGVTHTLGVNHLSDMTNAEIKSMNGYLGRTDAERQETLLTATDVPASVDWRTK